MPCTARNLAAIQAGKHVLSEKPFAGNADEARVVRDAAAAAQVTMMEGFHYLYHPLTRRLHELLDSGELGELRAAEIDMFMPAPDDRDPRWSYELAGGALTDIGCYSLHAHRALAPWATGRPGRRPPAPANVPGARESMNGSTPTWNSPAAPPDGPVVTWPPANGDTTAGSSAAAARRPP